MKVSGRILALALVLALLVSASASAWALDVPGHTKDRVEKEKITLSKDSLSALLEEYERIVREVEANSRNRYEDMRFGVLSDLDGDGYPELLLMYSPNGEELEALVACRTGKAKMESVRQYVCTLAGGANGSFGLGKDGKETVLHIIYRNSAGPTRRMGWDAVMSFSDGSLSVKHTLEWIENTDTGNNDYEVDGKSDGAKYRELYGSVNTFYRSPEDLGAASFEDLLQQIRRY